MSFKDMAREFMHHVPLAKFHPVLLTCLKEYDSRMLSRDISAGLTVGMVALPLAMAFGIASGVPPESGLYTAIIAGFLISLLGGCRVQIGGPAGAFVVIIYGIIAQYGLSNLMLATLGSGVILFLMGLFKIGGFIKFIPVSIVIGFTNGIAVMIACSRSRTSSASPSPRCPPTSSARSTRSSTTSARSIRGPSALRLRASSSSSSGPRAIR